MEKPYEPGYNLSALFSAFDTVLSLHFCSSITVPKVQDLCDKATQLTKRRIDKNTLECILAYYPEAYQIVHFGSNSSDFGVCTPSGVTPLRFGTLLSHRRKAFEDRLACSKSDSLPDVNLSDLAIPYINSCQDLLPMTNSSHHMHMESKVLGLESMGNGVSGGLMQMNQHLPVSKKERVLEQRIFSDGVNPLNRSSKGASGSLGRVRKLDLSNGSPKFKLKDTSSFNNVSLLERIRRKEKEGKLEDKHFTDQNSRLHFIQSKSFAVYEFLFELSHQNIHRHKSFIVFPMGKMLSMIKDSVSGFMTDLEIRDVIQELSATLSKKVNIMRAGELQVVKVRALNRQDDLLLLKQAMVKTA